MPDFRVPGRFYKRSSERGANPRSEAAPDVTDARFLVASYLRILHRVYWVETGAEYRALRIVRPVPNPETLFGRQSFDPTITHVAFLAWSHAAMPADTISTIMYDPYTLDRLKA